MFNGYDFTEVCIALGWKQPTKKYKLEYDDVAIAYARERISWASDKFFGHVMTCGERQKAKGIEKRCRDYLAALIKTGRAVCVQPLWVGLSKVKDSGTFLQYFGELLPSLWS